MELVWDGRPHHFRGQRYYAKHAPSHKFQDRTSPSPTSSLDSFSPPTSSQPNSAPQPLHPTQPCNSQQPLSAPQRGSSVLSCTSQPQSHTPRAPSLCARSSRVEARAHVSMARMNGVRAAAYQPPSSGELKSPCNTLQHHACQLEDSNDSAEEEIWAPTCSGHLTRARHPWCARNDLPTSQLRVDLSELSTRSHARSQRLQQLRGRVAATLDLALSSTEAMPAAGPIMQPAHQVPSTRALHASRPARASARARASAAQQVSSIPAGAGAGEHRQGNSSLSASGDEGRSTQRAALSQAPERLSSGDLTERSAQPPRPFGSQVALLAASASSRRRVGLAQAAAALVAAEQEHGRGGDRMFQRLTGASVTRMLHRRDELEELPMDLHLQGTVHEAGMCSQEAGAAAENRVQRFSCVAKQSEEEPCAICLTMKTVGEQVRMLGCGHTLHHPCLHQLLLVSASCVCPLCRTVTA